MENQPLTSIGVPVYNGGKYLEECLQSILDQTYENWECVIVDNKSTDETNHIAKDFLKKDARFRLVENTDFVDQTTNWNISYKENAPEAKYFKIVPADDWLFPEYVEKFVEVMEKYPSTGICSSYRINDKKVGCDKLDIYDGQFYNGKEILLKHLLLETELTGSINVVMFRVDTLRSIPGHPDIFKPGVYHIDSDLAYEIMNISDLGFVFQVLSYTRRHNETYTSLISIRFKTYLYFRERQLYLYRDLDPRLEKIYKRVRKSYAMFLIRQWFKRDKECIAWHKKHLDKERQFTMVENVKALLSRIA